MSKQREKSNKITIYLIKEGIEYDYILKEKIYDNILCKGNNSITYYEPTISTIPVWLNSFYKLKQDVNISNANSKVISLHRLIINNKERIFAIVFGKGKYLLNDDVTEEQFGIKVLLNSVPKDGFRQINCSNYGGNHRTRKEIIPKKTNISEFGFDIHNDFLSKATAKSDDELFNKNTITGGDLLSVTVPVNIDNVNDFLIACYEKYLSDKYKESFGWLDNIKEVKEKNLKNFLNAELIKLINQRDFDKVLAAIPETIEWEKVLDFRLKVNQLGYDDIEISTIIESYKNGVVPSIESLKSKRIYAISNEDGESLNDWSIYNCLIAEIEYEKNEYCLNFGKWYKLNSDFVQSTNDYYDNIPLSNIEFPNSTREREDVYNEKLNKHLKNSILMDKKTVRTHEIGRSSIELCDVLTNDNQLIHIKKNGGSSYLSHLFNQAAVSGEMLLDEKFRNESNKEIGKNYFEGDFIASKYSIILGIITRKNTDRPDIPFFSKVAIQYAINGLRRKGYTVELKNIYDEEI